VQPGQASIGRAQLPQDLSPWGMFLNADIVVKLVMLGLAFASLVTWTVYVAKAFELAAARRQIRRGLRILSGAATLAQAHEQLRKEDGTAAQLMQAANGLCEAALRDPSSLSRSGLAEIQRLFAVCLEAGRPLQDQLMQRIAERGTVTKAAKAYRPRRGPR